MMSTGTPPFTGFQAGATGFFADLVANNDRDFWQAHRETFEREVRGPMTALAVALEPRYGSLRLFRMNRDVRFSRNKSPYKLQLGAVGDRPEGGVLYVHLDADGLFVAAGYHLMGRDQRDRFRAMVADDRSGPELAGVIDGLSRTELTVSGGIETPLTGTPRGYPKDHPRITLLRWKGVMASRRIDDPDLLASAALADEIARTWERERPLLRLLDRHVGPSELPAAW